MSENRNFQELILDVKTDDEFTAKAQRVIEHVGATKAEDVVCMLGIVATKETVKIFSLGTDAQVVKMLLGLADVIKHNMQAANNPPTPTPDEAKH